MGYVGNGPHPMLKDIMDAVDEVGQDELLKIYYSDKTIEARKDQIRVGAAALRLDTKVGILWIPFESITLLHLNRR